MTITMVTIDARHDRIPRAHPRIGCTNHVTLADNSHDRASVVIVRRPRRVLFRVVPVMTVVRVEIILPDRVVRLHLLPLFV
jgi:hypothetical protein